MESRYFETSSERVFKASATADTVAFSFYGTFLRPASILPNYASTREGLIETFTQTYPGYR